MADQVKTKRSRADTWIVIYLGFSAVALTALIVAVVTLLIQNSQRISAQHQNNIRQCQIANNTRQQDIAIWNRLLRIPPGTKTTAAQKAEIKELERLVKAKDTPRDCAAAFQGG
jgi:hypothetical protein